MAMEQLSAEATPFRETKHETLFKNIANVTLRGTTFNATHMDKFLNSEYGERTHQSVIENKLAPATEKSAVPSGPLPSEIAP